MKKIFVGLAVLALVFCHNIVTAQVSQPVVPDHSKFELVSPDVCRDKSVSRYDYVSGRMTIWVKYLLLNETNPSLLLRLESNDSVKIWIDTNFDGTFDEEFDSVAAVSAKYKTPCEAIVLR